jgi:hypothetical protein
MKVPCNREKFTRERSAARKLAKEYFQRFTKDRYKPRSKAGSCCNRRIEFTKNPRERRASDGWLESTEHVVRASSKITASVSLVIDRVNLAAPIAAVSPDTPALPEITKGRPVRAAAQRYQSYT